MKSRICPRRSLWSVACGPHDLGIPRREAFGQSRPNIMQSEEFAWVAHHRMVSAVRMDRKTRRITLRTSGRGVGPPDFGRQDHERRLPPIAGFRPSFDRGPHGTPALRDAAHRATNGSRSMAAGEVKLCC